jgi:ribulose-phosphate 3-epimerase
MGAIVPAVLPKNLNDLEEKLKRFEGIADSVQIDVIDGRYAAPASWPYTEGSEELAQRAAQGENLPCLGSFSFDIDLMVSDPEEVIGSWITLGASRITVHAESTRYLSRIVSDFDVKYGHRQGFAPELLSLGLAIGVATDLGILEPYLPRIDYVQFMGIATIGRQGEPFDARALERVTAFHKKHPEIEIQVDGGVSMKTAPALLEAGADRLVVGSALRDAHDVRASYDALEALTHEYGIYE